MMKIKVNSDYVFDPFYNKGYKITIDEDTGDAIGLEEAFEIDLVLNEDFEFEYLKEGYTSGYSVNVSNIKTDEIPMGVIRKACDIKILYHKGILGNLIKSGKLSINSESQTYEFN